MVQTSISLYRDAEEYLSTEVYIHLKYISFLENNEASLIHYLMR